MEFTAGRFPVIVIGAGHAGIEAALAAARLGVPTAIFSLSLDAVGNMPCNPAIGGTGKGHLVREIDALGGMMGKAADATCIQYRMLNLGKGPAVHSLRAQADRRAYQDYMKDVLENTEHVTLIQAEISEILLKDGRVAAVKTTRGAVYETQAAVIACGTFLGGRVIIGEFTQDAGPDGLFPATELSKCLQELGVTLRRFKTGTPPRVNKNSIDFSAMVLQEGDREVVPFSFETTVQPENSAVCHLTYTTPLTHEIIRNSLDKSPLYTGVIEGVGPRYCPSIEDKVVRFADKERHQLFIEPMGLHTAEMYVQGFSSSMPEDVQIAMLRSVDGMQNAQIMRPAYAIEYDCVDPLELLPTLELKKIGGLFGAGQFNGSSGYEEAAAQGLVAGANAALGVLGREAFTLSRSEAYIGVLIDDLVTKGTNEPYRMMTSRCEYRLVLRQDNADVRLAEKAFGAGLISAERLAAVQEKARQVQQELQRLCKLSVSPGDANPLLAQVGSTPLSTGVKFSELLKRPEVSYALLAPLDKDCSPELSPRVLEQVEIELTYAGYIKREEARIAQFDRMEKMLLPAGLDYLQLQGLRIEARQKLLQLQPRSLGQASRISGVNPADIAALMVYLEAAKKNVSRETFSEGV